MLRKLREEDPPQPSTRSRTADKESKIAAQNRRTEPKALAKQLRGDLDAITLKALEKDRTRRYGAPSELAADIGRSPIYTNVLEGQRRALGEEHPETLRTMRDLALLYTRQGKYAQAESLLRKALNSYQKNMPNTWDEYDCQALLGVSLAGQKKYAEAEPMLLSAYAGMIQSKGKFRFSAVVSIRNTAPVRFGRADLETTGEAIVKLYQHWVKMGKAAEWRQRLDLDRLYAADQK
jgi:tetratricopeptide (TPR) repeat protein